MSSARSEAGSRLAALARPSGAFAMVAIDQRDSLRTIFREEGRTEAPDEALVAFKLAVSRQLSWFASALLVDTAFALRPMLEADALAGGCGLIVAADELVQDPGGPVRETRIDSGVDPDEMRRLGASALKLLVIWRDDEAREARRAMVTEFVQRCRGSGLASVVEGIVRPRARAELNQAIEAAARDLGEAGPDLYKAEVPYYGAAEPAQITAAARRLSDWLPCPWVVLSQGVAPERFAAAVEAACRGGASGFLAGRAIWRDAVGTDAAGVDQRLRERAVPRLERLGRLVDELARPWSA